MYQDGCGVDYQFATSGINIFKANIDSELSNEVIVSQ